MAAIPTAISSCAEITGRNSSKLIQDNEIPEGILVLLFAG